MERTTFVSIHTAPSSAALLCTADLLLYPGNLWVRRHLGVSTVVVWAQDTKHGDTRCYQGWPTSGSGPLIEYTSLDKLGYRCKDDLSSVSGVAELVLDPCGVDTWSPHVLWLGWGSSPPTPASRGQELGVTRTELSCCSGDVESRVGNISVLIKIKSKIKMASSLCL